MSLKMWAIWLFGALTVLVTGLRYPTEGSTVTVIFTSAPSAIVAIERLAVLDALAIGASSNGRVVTARFQSTPSPIALHAAGILVVLPQGIGMGCRAPINI